MNRSTQRLLQLFVSSFILAALSACGGGGGGSAPSSVVSAAYSGPIAGLGSIVVNGVRFETLGVSVEDSDDIYGTSAYNKSLELGMTVALGGNVDPSTQTGTPSKIRVIGGIRGQVSASTTNSITTASGQTVTVDANTIYAGLRTTLATIAVNDWVEIYVTCV